jgi:SAM-dependent methyltransferase
VTPGLFTDPSVRFAGELRAAEDRLRAAGLGGRRAFSALARHLSARLGLDRAWWPDGPDAPPSARLEELALSGEIDLFGLAYERFFTDLFKGSRGQYFTPRPLIELLADLARVRPGDTVLDPTCGTGGFLVAALARGADAEGVEVDPDLASLARLNVTLHGARAAAVRTADFFRLPPEDRYDVVLANPPFSLVIDDPGLLAGYRSLGGASRVTSDHLFIEAALRCLRPGGRLATVLPYSILTNRRLAGLRAWIDAEAVREAVIALPEGVFLPFGGTSTRACLLVVRRRPAPVAPCLMAAVRWPGYDPRRRSWRPAPPDELLALRLYLRGGPFPAARRVEDAGWVPDEVLSERPPATVPTFAISERARVLDRTPAVGGPVRAVQLADVDKTTGELQGWEVRAESSGLQHLGAGELLVGRMRPENNNVTRLREDASWAGSGEWFRLRADDEPEFLLLALRSSFARAQLLVTDGQTRPRARVEDLAAMRLPDPGPVARRALDEAMRGLHTSRARTRAALARLAEGYEAFGRGEIAADDLTAIAWQAVDRGDAGRT